MHTTFIDGLLYKLNDTSLTVMVANENSWEGELDIPERVTYEGKTYTVDRIEWLGTFPDGFRNDTFYFMDDEVVIYVRQSEIEKLKSEFAKLKSFTGTVLPLEAYHPSAIDMPAIDTAKTSSAFDLQGRPAMGRPAKGIYIQNGRKMVR